MFSSLTLCTLALIGLALLPQVSDTKQNVFLSPDMSPMFKVHPQTHSLKLKHVFMHDVNFLSSIRRLHPNTNKYTAADTERMKQGIRFARKDIHTSPFVAEDLQVQTKIPNLPFASVSRSFANSYRPRRQTMPPLVVPDATDKLTVLSMAYMSSNAYNYPANTSTGWIPVPGYGLNITYGYEGDGLQGYVFSNDEEDLLVMAIKGTSASFLGVGGGATATKDKYFDNLMFSCCCGTIDRAWRPICPCSNLASQHCDEDCLYEYANAPDSYFNVATKIYDELAQMYPKATIWLTGHSLGGALAALTALEVGSTAIAFEAPGDLLYAKRLGFYLNRFMNLPIWHFGNTGDPIFMGQCTGVSSACYLAGYALETRCHVGHVCALDFKENMDIRAHRMADVIDKLQSLDPFAPLCRKQIGDCFDCSNWTD